MVAPVAEVHLRRAQAAVVQVRRPAGRRRLDAREARRRQLAERPVDDGDVDDGVERRGPVAVERRRAHRRHARHQEVVGDARLRHRLEARRALSVITGTY